MYVVGGLFVFRIGWENGVRLWKMARARLEMCRGNIWERVGESGRVRVFKYLASTTARVMLA